MYKGDWLEDSTGFTHKFTTRNTTGEASALSSGLIDVYKGSSTSPSTAGVTLTSTFASVVGFNHLGIDLSSTSFYSNGEEYTAILSQGEVNGVDVTGEVVCSFSIGNRIGSVLTTTDIADELGTYGGSTHTSTDIDDSLANYGASTWSSTEVRDELSSYGASTLGTTEITDGHNNYGASTHTSTDIDDSLNTYGASTHTSTDITDAINTYGGSTHTTTDITDVMRSDSLAELAAVPAANASIADKVNWLFLLARNYGTQTGTLKSVFADGSTSTVVATATVSASTDQFIREEYT